jgi:hypothetical protein
VPLAFPPAEIWDVTWSSFDQFSLPGSPLGLAPPALAALGISHHEALDILEQIRQLCCAEATKPLSVLNEKQRMDRSDLFLRLETRLHAIVQSTPLSSTDRWNNVTWRSVALTALIFVQHFLRGTPLYARQFSTLITLLYEVLAAMKALLEELAFARPLLLWVLSVGAVASQGMLCHDWFVRKLAAVCKSYGMNQESLLDTLRDGLWTGNADEVRYASVWNEVEAVGDQT